MILVMSVDYEMVDIDDIEFESDYALMVFIDGNEDYDNYKRPLNIWQSINLDIFHFCTTHSTLKSIPDITPLQPDTYTMSHRSQDY